MVDLPLPSQHAFVSRTAHEALSEKHRLVLAELSYALEQIDSLKARNGILEEGIERNQCLNRNLRMHMATIEGRVCPQCKKRRRFVKALKKIAQKLANLKDEEIIRV